MEQEKQEYVLNENASFFNCNICGDLQIRMTGDGEQPPEEGCCNPECPSSINREPVPGLKIYYSEY